MLKKQIGILVVCWMASLQTFASNNIYTVFIVFIHNVCSKERVVPARQCAPPPFAAALAVQRSLNAFKLSADAHCPMVVVTPVAQSIRLSAAAWTAHPTATIAYIYMERA